MINTFPIRAKRLLSAIVQTDNDKELFLNDFLPKFQNIYMAIADFRIEILKNRNDFSFEDFCNLYQQKKDVAISKLFLYPHEDLTNKFLISKIEEGNISLHDVYQFQLKNPIFNPILAGKKLWQLPNSTTHEIV